jgi:hypothetical protein
MLKRARDIVAYDTSGCGSLDLGRLRTPSGGICSQTRGTVLFDRVLGKVRIVLCGYRVQ